MRETFLRRTPEPEPRNPRRRANTPTTRAAILLPLGLFAIGCQSPSSEFRPLFDGKGLTGWKEIGSTGAWSVEDGVLKCNGKRDGYAWLCTRDKYADFVLRIEWRLWKGGNSGVFCRVPSEEGRASLAGFEVQVIDDAIASPRDGISGSIFSRVAAKQKAARALGEWNVHEITCRGTKLHVACNGVTTVDVDMAAMESMREVPTAGFIGLQNHGHPVEFRRVEIRELDEGER